ncbi:hypothetical protein EMGR_001566 [Emarellia grisea]
MTADSPAACSRLERSLQSLFSNLSSDLCTQEFDQDEGQEASYELLV